jgi:TonB family protein
LGIRYESPRFRWQRLAACLAVSAGLHALMVAQVPPPRWVHVTKPIFVRLAEEPDHALTDEPPQRKRARHGESKPVPSSRSPVARRVPAGPAKPPDQISQLIKRTAYPRTYDAYGEFPEELQKEVLTAEQRSVPRGNTFAEPPQPIQPIVPQFPENLLRRGLRARILLEIFLNAGGAVEDVVVVDDQGQPELAPYAVQAVRTAAFAPAAGPSGPVRSRVTMRVFFDWE